jgi:protein TonB
MKVALIGPNEAHRKIVAKALAGSEARAVREFVDYPAKLGDLPQMLDQHYDVIMIDVDSDQTYALKVIEAVASITSAMVMAYSKRNDADLLMNCMRAGARDFLPLPEADPEPAPAPPSGPQLVAPDPRPVPSGAPRAFEPPASVTPRPIEQQTWPAEPTSFVQPPAPPAAPRPFEPARPAEPVSYAQPIAAPEPKADEFSALASLAELRKNTPSHSLQQDIDAWDEAHLRAPQPSVVKGPAPIQPPSALRAAEPITPPVVTPPAPARIDSQPLSTPAVEPQKTSFDDWDSAFLRTPQASANPSAGISPRTVIAPAPVAPPAPPRVEEIGSRLVTPADILATPESEQSSFPADTSIFSQTRPKIDRASLPVFHYEVPEEEKLQQGGANKWILWVAVAAGAVALGGGLAFYFLHPFQHNTPAAQQPQSAVPQPQAPPAWQPVAGSDQPSASPAKPSAATPAGNIATANIPATNAPTATQGSASRVSSYAMDAQLAAPSRISKDVRALSQTEEAPPVGFASVSLDSSGGAPGTVFGGQKQLQVVAGVHSISSGVAEGMLIRKIEPIYPKFAKDSRIGGTVTLRATITKTGSIEGLQVVSGPKILSESALNAVKYWRYKPYYLNNQPVDVQTTINVVFNLNTN